MSLAIVILLFIVVSLTCTVTILLNGSLLTASLNRYLFQG